MLGQGERVAFQNAVRGRFAPSPPLPPPTFSPAATVWPLLGGKQPLLLLRIRSDTPARGATIPLGLVTLRPSFLSRGRGVGSVCRSLSGQPGPPAAKKGAACPPWCVWCDPGSPGGLGLPARETALWKKCSQRFEARKPPKNYISSHSTDVRSYFVN